MAYKTKFLQDLTTINIEVFEEVVLFGLNRDTFFENVQNLHKPSLQALVYLLVMRQRGTLPPNILDRREVSAENLIKLIHKGYWVLPEDNERFGWHLKAVALMVLYGDDNDASKMAHFIHMFDRELTEIPHFYDVIRVFLLLGLENPQLIDCFGVLNKNQMIRRLASDSHELRMKALACLQTMLELFPDLYREWLAELHDPKLLIETRTFMLYHLMEALLRVGDRKEEILQTLRSDQVWEIVIASLTSKDAVCRKEGLATLQYAVGYAKQCERDITGQYFNWSSDNERSRACLSVWDSFVIVVEALNESQTHLILPALELMGKVSPLHVAWKNVLLRLILQHENHRVVNCGLQHFLNERLFDATESDLEKRFLETFNRMAVFENVPETIASLCGYYSAPEALAFLLTTVQDISWNSIPFYCVANVIHDRINALEPSPEGSPIPLKSLTNCVKTCQQIKNVSIRYVTVVLLLKAISRIVNRYKSKANAALLLTAVCAIESLSTVFSITLDRIRDDTGSTLCDAIAEDDLMVQLPNVRITDTFFVKELLMRHISSSDPPGQEQLVKTFARTNVPVCLHILNHLPQSASKYADEIADAICTEMDHVKRAVETEEPITSGMFSMLREMIDFVQASKTFRRAHEWSEILEDLHRHVNSRLALFEYSPSLAVKTIQITHLLTVHMGHGVLAEKFFHAVSLTDLTESFQRHQTPGPPSIDDLYTMIAAIYLRYCQSRQHSAFASEEDLSKLVGLLDVGNMDVLTLVMEILLTDTPDVERYYDAGRLVVVDRCYKEVLNYRKSDHFMKLIKKFIEMLLHPYIRLTDEDPDLGSVEIHPRVTEYVAMFLEQASTIYGLANIVFETVFRVPVAVILNWGSFGKLLLEGMIFGVVQKRDQKIEHEVVEQCGLDIPFKQHPRHLARADARVRVLCVLFLYRIVRTNHPDAVLFLLKLERMLYERFVQITKAKERYYADSITHRQKLRIVQALCVVVKLTGNKPYSLLDVMLYETNQPNINYLLELIVADSSIDTLTIANSLRNDRVKVSGIQSVFVILWLRCCQKNSLDEQYIYLLLPWTMAQNFSTRLYAQITITKLIAKFSPQPIESGPFREIYAAVNSYLRQGNVERNIEKCMKDFRFNSVFDYGNLLTVENVFHNIPKVSAAPAEDFVGTAILKECLQTLGLGESNLGHALEFDELQLSEKKENLFLAQSVGGADFVQRKIVPLKNLVPGQDSLYDLPEQLRSKKMDFNEGLIVVASLVNRAPNLGGLARTCEIFAVEQFVINSLQDVTNKEFQALSMTAEKWLNLGELKTFQIVEYLKEMKSKGYAVVGAEQTTGSKPIQQLKFPKKSILVLGHEKNGLPAEVIRHLDLIGEIPQFGVVRSLNVHVTGAIFMWEYAKQHLVAECRE